MCIRDRIKTALKQLGFADVYETAIGADIGAATEAEHYVKEVATGELPFLLTSCSVSYTHLDVYKRQEKNIQLLEQETQTDSGNIHREVEEVKRYINTHYLSLIHI